jgi:hypothetical protein
VQVRSWDDSIEEIDVSPVKLRLEAITHDSTSITLGLLLFTIYHHHYDYCGYYGFDTDNIDNDCSYPFNHTTPL